MLLRIVDSLICFRYRVAGPDPDEVGGRSPVQEDRRRLYKVGAHKEQVRRNGRKNRDTDDVSNKRSDIFHFLFCLFSGAKVLNDRLYSTVPWRRVPDRGVSVS